MNQRAADRLTPELTEAAYSCFTSAHKFCREVCPVTQVTQNENHTPTAFNANVQAIEAGHLTVSDVAEDYTHCTLCGACELRCPNTLLTGDFYDFRTRTTDIVKAVRAAAVDVGAENDAWQEWNAETRRLRNEPVADVESQDVRGWAQGLGLEEGGETILFCDCEAAFHRRSVPRAAALLLREAGVEFGLMKVQWCCGGPALEMGYSEIASEFAEHNIADWLGAGARRIITLDPHDYLMFVEDYPKLLGRDLGLEIVHITEVLDEAIADGRLKLDHPVTRVATYHDPCRLNKRRGITEAPRRILRAVPGLEFRDLDRVSQWFLCSGGGGGLAIAHPEITAELSRRRLDQAAAMEVDTLVSACVWSERPMSAAGEALTSQIDVLDLTEIVADACGLDYRPIGR
ncbi:MAG: (Fe-S)-binding protein [bacterium]